MRTEFKPSPKVPKKYCGLWIAWNHERTKIVASGKTFPEAFAAAEAAGAVQPYFTKAPHATSRFVGGSR
jgi:hypothetical protein